MKVALPTDDQKNIAAHFGRAKGFMVFDIENDIVTDKQYVPNRVTGHALGLHKEEEAGFKLQQSHHHHHGDGHHSHEGILSAIGDCEVVISRGMGRRLIEDFKQNQTRVILTPEEDIDRAVCEFTKGTLISDGKPCNHHH